MGRIAARSLGVSLVLAGVVVLAAGPLDTWPVLVRWFGPPQHEAQERYPSEGTATVDHSLLDALLHERVHEGWVDYAALSADPRLESYLAVLAEAPWDDLSRDERLALTVNAYNAFTLALIVDHGPLASIMDIPESERWDAERWRLAGRTVSLSVLEHDELRRNFVEPRIHFAINCASVGCPLLRSEAYVAERIEDQLEQASAELHADPRWVRVEGNTAHLTKLYAWYAADFEQVAGSSLAYAGRWRPRLARGELRVQWIDYDWSLNGGGEGW
jgi:hypothetical protein